MQSKDNFCLCKNYKITNYLYAFFFQLFIEAYDQRVPTEIINSWVTVNFDRNLNPPVFRPNTYTAAIADYDAPGTSVTTVTASDIDVLVNFSHFYKIVLAL